MQKILIPTDFSPVADNAVQFAFAFAKKNNAEFVFFHAGPEDIKKLEAHVNHFVKDNPFTEGRMKYITADVDFKPEAIKTLISEHKIDLVIMGTHGSQAPFPTAIFGSNTSAIMEEISVPLIAVPADFVFNGISRIAYAADLINFRQELKTVIQFARTTNASINILHVTPVFPDLYDLEKMEVNAIIDEMKQSENFNYITYHVEETEKDNQVTKGINNFIDEHSTDLLVLFHTSRSWIDKIISPSTSAKEVTRVRVPVMIFPKEV